MKRNLTFLLILISLSLNSQSLFNNYEEGKITYRDGNEETGFIKISINDKIKFKKTKEDKKTILNYKKVKKVKFLNGDEYLYKITIKNKRILLIKRRIVGKLELYSYTRSSPGLMTPNGMMMGGSTTTAYLIGKRDSDLIEHLPINPKKNKFRKIIMKYTSDCPKFLKLIKDKKSVKENFAKDYSGFFQNQGTAVEDMINFYNGNCN
ncbi:hypothetical protein [Tenacibaculum sp.]|uniref:hypothetical protein n=1 Tax=Tenacibaculum sp. TaxID=1906242 RepID=UPI003D11AA63